MNRREENTGGFCWFAARTHSGQEVAIRDRLEKMGVEYFIPTETRKNYRGKTKEHPLIPALIFVHATKQRACELKTLDQLPVNFLFDYTAHTMLTVPDKQMEDFRRVLDVSIREGGLVEISVAAGDRVRVARGPLRGVEGRVMDLKGEYYVVVSLLGSVFAKAQVPRAWLEMAG
ncbi:MAG: UpxY family transcription antiterminator [Bacteroidales bacterium]|nr:UpxY family transcription antiterminator [Bacteroidales bacterium]